MVGHSNQPTEVIDLTSDTEDTGISPRASSKENGHEKWRDTSGLTVSNHGLPDPEEFKKSSNINRIKLTSQSARSANTSLLPNANTSVESTMLPRVDPTQAQNVQRQHAPILPGSTIQSRQGALDLKSGNSVNTGGSASIYKSNDSKGRGTALHNGQYSPIRPSMAKGSASGTRDTGLASKRSEGREQQRSNSAHPSHSQPLDTTEDISFTYSPLRTESQPSDLKRRKHERQPYSNVSNGPREPSRDKDYTWRPPILPPPKTSKTIITGASRVVDSASPKIGLNGASPQLGQRTPREERERTLKTQVIPHTRAAMSQHEGVVPDPQLQKIGAEVLQSLVNSPGFQQNLGENDNKLSRDYEQSLARAAQNGIAFAVNRYKRDCASHFNPTQHDDPLMSGFQSAIPEANNATPASANSPDSMEIFENSHELQQGPGLSRSRARDTSSPATSFSNSREESQQISEDDEGDVQSNTTRRFNPRRARAPQKNYRLPGRRVTASLTRQTTQDTEHQKSHYDCNRDKKVATLEKRPLVAEDRKQSSTDGELTAKRFRIVKESTLRQHSQQVSNNESKGVAPPARRSRTVKKHSHAVPPCPPVMSSSAVPSARDKVQLMARQRELYGMVPVGLQSGKSSYKTVATNALEDSLVRDYQWASQSGDAVTITRTGQSTFVSGALTHYDVHNMQYNRHGNLVVGSTSSKKVKMVDGHRTLRPVVTPEENKENSLPAMRATQDDWRYAPVVSSAYCEVNDYTFTASYDKTVKIWKVSESGPDMELRGIWEHDHFVNFVVTSKYHDKVATASEARNHAVRVYMFDENDESQSAYDVYNADRATNRPGDLRMADKWAYHPATLQWGRARSVSHLLLVGYSPRGTNSEEEIPQTKKNSGELCCWNTITGEQLHINAGKSQNVFEVIWHPTQPIFLVAVAPSGTYDTKRTKIQVRMFQLQGKADFESFQCIKTLDCPASDVNELTIMPTSTFGAYVTASCTDGRTYVWDTMHEDRVLHVLAHGESIDNPDPDIPIEMADSGVKFAAWGQTPNRFYTGSSDGAVKVWDITQPKSKSPFLRDILQAPGGIACGVFSSDYMQLLVGDATGHLHLIQALDDESDTRDPLMLPMTRRSVMIPHADPQPPQNASLDAMEVDGKEQDHQKYLNEGILREFPMNIPGFEHRKKIGQGPHYDEVNLYREELHVDGDHNKPLLPEVAASNRVHQLKLMQSVPQKAEFLILPPVNSSLKRRQRNDDDLELDFELLLISNPSQEFKRDLEISGEYLYDFED